MNEVYVYTLLPLELLYKYLYLILVSLTENYGWALLALSFLNYFLLLPLNKLVRKAQKSESHIQEVLAPQLRLIKETSRDAERHRRVHNLYQRYSYHPIFALRNVFPLLVQLPFLMAVYFMLSTLENIEGVSFLFIHDLARPDALVCGYNFMPFVMTLVSLLNAAFVVKLTASQKKQAIVVALVFFVLLYTAPAALLLYWTMNNIVMLAMGLLSKNSSALRVSTRLLPSPIHSSGLLLGLSFIIPLCFTLSLNFYLFNDAQICKFGIFVIASLILFLLFGIGLDKLIQKALNIALPLKLRAADVVYLGIALLSAYFLTILCTDMTRYVPSYQLIDALWLTLAAILFLLTRRFQFKAVNVVMLALLAFCAVQFATVQHQNRLASAAVDVLAKKAFKDFPIHEKLTLTPSIYLVYLESYANSKVLRDTYRHDNSIFEQFLVNKGFTLYDDIHAHACFTKGSLMNLLMMQDDIRSVCIGNQDLVSRANDIVGGSKDNLLFHYLKSNGYSLSAYYDKQSYYFNKRGRLLDHCTEDVDSSLARVISEIAPYLGRKLEFIAHSPEVGSAKDAKDIYPEVFRRISKRDGDDAPAFFLLKPLNDLHVVHSRRDVLTSYQTWISSGIYQKGVRDMNKELTLLINTIEDHDPHALIVLLGDHGHKYVDGAGLLLPLDMTPAEIKERFPQFHMTSQEMVDDMFSAFLAIKMPKNASGTLSIDERFAYADLFRHLFAALDGNPSFLEYQSEDISMNHRGDVLKRGDAIFEQGEH